MTNQLQPETLEHSSGVVSIGGSFDRSSSAGRRVVPEGSARAIQLKMPQEHGAWGILLVPLLCSATVAPSRNAPLLLSALCALALFLLCGSLQAQAPRSPAEALLAPVH